MKLNNNLNMNGNEIINVKIENTTEFPTQDLVEGRLIYHITDKKYYYYNGDNWVAINGSNTSSIPDSTSYGFLAFNLNGEPFVIDTVSLYKSMQNYESAKNKDMILKIGQNGQIGGYPFVVDNGYMNLTPTSIWGDCIPTSGCVFNAIKNMAVQILGYSAWVAPKGAIFITDKSGSGELALLDVTSGLNSDEEAILFVNSNGVFVKKLSDYITKEDYDLLVENLETIKEQAAINRSALGCQSKNLLKNTAVTTTLNGVTFTINDDGSVTVNGSATTLCTFTISDIPTDLQGQTLWLSGCPANGNYQTGYSLIIDKASDTRTVDFDTGNGIKVTVPDEACRVRIVIRDGVTVNDLTFKPMLRYAEIMNDTYEAYKPSITEYITNLEKRIEILEGGK